MAREFGGEPSAEAISRLPRYAFVGQVTDRGTVSAPFAIGGIRVEDALGFEGDHEGVDALRVASAQATRRRTPGEAIDHLETLDETILAALGELTAGSKSDRRSTGEYRSGTRLGGSGS